MFSDILERYKKLVEEKQGQEQQERIEGVLDDTPTYSAAISSHGCKRCDSSCRRCQEARSAETGQGFDDEINRTLNGLRRKYLKKDGTNSAP